MTDWLTSRYTTYLKHVLHGPRFQQFDAAVERQRGSFDVFATLYCSAAAGHERRIHSDMLFAARKWPENDSPEDGLRERRACLFYPLKRYVSSYHARRNVQQSVRNERLFAAASRNRRFWRSSPGTTAKSFIRTDFLRHFSVNRDTHSTVWQEGGPTHIRTVLCRLAL